MCNYIWYVICTTCMMYIRKNQHKLTNKHMKSYKFLMFLCSNNPYLVRNSEMGREERIGERSPLAIRRISGWRSSYLITGTLDLNVFRSVAPRRLNLRRYSVSAFWASISANTFSCTSSQFLVISWMNWRALANFSLVWWLRSRGGREVSTAMIWSEKYFLARNREKIETYWIRKSTMLNLFGEWNF